MVSPVIEKKRGRGCTPVILINLEYYLIFGRVTVCAKMVQQMESKASSGEYLLRNRRRWERGWDVEVVDDEVDDEAVDVGVSVVV